MHTRSQTATIVKHENSWISNARVQTCGLRDIGDRLAGSPRKRRRLTDNVHEVSWGAKLRAHREMLMIKMWGMCVELDLCEAVQCGCVLILDDLAQAMEDDTSGELIGYHSVEDCSLEICVAIISLSSKQFDDVVWTTSGLTEMAGRLSEDDDCQTLTVGVVAKLEWFFFTAMNCTVKCENAITLAAHYMLVAESISGVYAQQPVCTWDLLKCCTFTSFKALALTRDSYYMSSHEIASHILRKCVSAPLDAGATDAEIVCAIATDHRRAIRVPPGVVCCEMKLLWGKDCSPADAYTICT